MPAEDRLYWNQRFRVEGWRTEPSSFLLSLNAVLPSSGQALDIAGGPGQNALWLAGRGLDTALVDISEVALDMAARAAEERSVTLELLQIDLEEEPIPAGPWDLIVCFNYLRRPLLRALGSALSPDGRLVLELATQINLERHQRPPEKYLLKGGEIPTLLPGLELVEYHERWWEDRHVAHVLAKPLRK